MGKLVRLDDLGERWRPSTKSIDEGDVEVCINRKRRWIRGRSIGSSR